MITPSHSERQTERIHIFFIRVAAWRAQGNTLAMYTELGFSAAAADVTENGANSKIDERDGVTHLGAISHLPEPLLNQRLLLAAGDVKLIDLKGI